MRVAQWPDDAPRGAVAQFCRRHGVSRAWFYKVLAKARAEGTWAATEVGSNRPLTSPCRPPQPTADALNGREATIRTGSRPKGVVTVFNCHFLLGAAWAGKEVRVLHDHRTIAFYDEEGTEILSHPRPPRGTRFVPRSGLKRPAPDQPSTDS
ncbi:hypothetical protein CGQ25_00005 [Sinomonas sp. R1AF57]|nr:hypothetical protein CGQ25_00005 [Sinomonas sp. R1AF57]